MCRDIIPPLPLARVKTVLSDATEKLFGDFTRETGIKIERDKMQYLRMKDKQLLELSKPQGDYDVITIGDGGRPNMWQRSCSIRWNPTS